MGIVGIDIIRVQQSRGVITIVLYACVFIRWLRDQWLIADSIIYMRSLQAKLWVLDTC